ncbi:MAG: DUF5615 family PIN-like protein [Anaerolineae bacterium]
MRVLIDECLPRKLKRELSEHDAKTVAEMGWTGIKNGALLRLMAEQFDAFITIDQNMQYQQNLQNAPLGIILLSAFSNRIEDLLPLVPRLRAVLPTLQAGMIVRIAINEIPPEDK